MREQRRADRQRENRADVGPKGASTPEDAISQLIALQRGAGNRATRRVLTSMAGDGLRRAHAPGLLRTLVLAKPGSEKSSTTYGATDLATVKGLFALDAWAVPWADTYIGQLLTSPVAYRLDEVGLLRKWVLVRGALDQLTTYLDSGPGDATDEGNFKAQALTSLRQECVTLRTAGELARPPRTYSLFGYNYAVEKGGENHYYLYNAATYTPGKKDNEPVQYGGRLRGGQARALVEKLVANQRDGRIGDKGAVDEFACSFVAEPTRWPPEHLFNLIGTDTTTALTGAASKTALPMASGTTWDKDRRVIAKETPQRAVAFAEGSGLWASIEACLPATSMQGFTDHFLRTIGVKDWG